MHTFKVGDRVRRNNISDDNPEGDGNDVPFGTTGVIEEITDDNIYYTQNIRVLFDGHDECWAGDYGWWIRPDCIEHLVPQTAEAKQQQVINKIKYLNDKFNNRKSRIVSNQVGLGEQRELREGAIGFIPQGVITGDSGYTSRTHMSATDIARVATDLLQLRRDRADAEQRGFVGRSFSAVWSDEF